MDEAVCSPVRGGVALILVEDSGDLATLGTFNGTRNCHGALYRARRCGLGADASDARFIGSIGCEVQSGSGHYLGIESTRISQQRDFAIRRGRDGPARTLLRQLYSVAICTFVRCPP